MEIILLIVVIILAFVANSRTSQLHAQIAELEQIIRGLAERIATFSAPPAAATAGAAPVEPDTEFPSARAASTPPDITRSEYVAEPTTPPFAPEPPITAPETIPSEQPAAFNIQEIPEQFRDQGPAQTPASADSADQPQTGTTDAPAQPEPSRPNFSDLEKRFGTQWVVWVGGVALALGGLCLAGCVMIHWQALRLAPAGPDTRVLLEGQILTVPARDGADVGFDAEVRVLQGPGTGGMYL